MIDASPNSSQVFAASETYQWQSPTVMVSKVAPKPVAKPTYVYRRSVIPLEGGKVLLRLRNEPLIEVNPNTLECEVVGWDVRIPHHEIGDVNRRMARKFLELFTKASADSLTRHDNVAWLRLLDEVDYAGFCHDRAAPQYAEGTLLRRLPECRVEWHDGTVERLSLESARALDVFQDGDRFGAFVKLGGNGEAKLLERVTLLTPSDGA